LIGKGVAVTVAVAETRVIFEEGVRVRVEFERERVVYKVGTVRVEMAVVFGKDFTGGVVVTAPKTEVAAPPRMEVMSEMRPRSPRCSALGMVTVWLPVGIGMVRVFTEEVVVWVDEGGGVGVAEEEATGGHHRAPGISAPWCWNATTLEAVEFQAALARAMRLFSMSKTM
jgi:hypothetical protein